MNKIVPITHTAINETKLLEINPKVTIIQKAIRFKINLKIFNLTSLKTMKNF